MSECQSILNQGKSVIFFDGILDNADRVVRRAIVVNIADEVTEGLHHQGVQLLTNKFLPIVRSQNDGNFGI
jgi:hypothetical protein